MAGINAALSLRGEAPLVLGRDQAYIGVLIDDLVTTRRRRRAVPHVHLARRVPAAAARGQRRPAPARDRPPRRRGRATTTSRARSAKRARSSGPSALLHRRPSSRRARRVNARLAALGSAPLRLPCPLAQLLRRPELALADVWTIAGVAKDVPRARLRGAGRGHGQVLGLRRAPGRGDRRARRWNGAAFPPSFDYAAIPGLSREAREKLSAMRPRSLGQASRIAGMTPAALSLLSIHLRRQGVAG